MVSINRAHKWTDQLMLSSLYSYNIISSFNIKSQPGPGAGLLDRLQPLPICGFNAILKFKRATPFRLFFFFFHSSFLNTMEAK